MISSATKPEVAGARGKEPWTTESDVLGSRKDVVRPDRARQGERAGQARSEWARYEDDPRSAHRMRCLRGVILVEQPGEFGGPCGQRSRECRADPGEGAVGSLAGVTTRKNWSPSKISHEPPAPHVGDDIVFSMTKAESHRSLDKEPGRRDEFGVPEKVRPDRVQRDRVVFDPAELPGNQADAVHQLGHHRADVEGGILLRAISDVKPGEFGEPHGDAWSGEYRAKPSEGVVGSSEGVTISSVRSPSNNRNQEPPAPLVGDDMICSATRPEVAGAWIKSQDDSRDVCSMKQEDFVSVYLKPLAA